MADENTGGTLTEVKVSEGEYIDGITVTLKDGSVKDFPLKYENEAALETSRIEADAAAKAANEAKAAVEANEEQRKTDEATRNSNESTRKEEFAKAKKAAEDQAAEAKKAAAAANTAKTLADDAAELVRVPPDDDVPRHLRVYRAAPLEGYGVKLQGRLVHDRREVDFVVAQGVLRGSRGCLVGARQGEKVLH